MTTNVIQGYLSENAVGARDWRMVKRAIFYDEERTQTAPTWQVDLFLLSGPCTGMAREIVRLLNSGNVTPAAFDAFKPSGDMK